MLHFSIVARKPSTQSIHGRSGPINRTINRVALVTSAQATYYGAGPAGENVLDLDVGDDGVWWNLKDCGAWGWWWDYRWHGGYDR